jgi:hypothetical protein
MSIKDSYNDIVEARKIAKQLNELLHEDALHRLKLHDQYAHETSKWTPNLYHRCQLMEALCRKLSDINLDPGPGNPVRQTQTRKKQFKETPKLAAYT